MDYDKLSLNEKIALIELTIKIKQMVNSGKSRVGYIDFDECAESMIKSAKNLAKYIAS